MAIFRMINYDLFEQPFAVIDYSTLVECKYLLPIPKTKRQDRDWICSIGQSMMIQPKLTLVIAISNYFLLFPLLNNFFLMLGGDIM